MTKSDLLENEVRSQGSIRRLADRHSMVVFVVLACVFSWWPVPFMGMMFGAGPFFAALVVLGLTDGKPGIRDLFRKIAMWRVNWKWYVVAIGLPAVAAVVAAGITVALGAPAPTSAELGAWTDILPFFLFIMLVPIFGPWEEPGFRGYALSGFLRRHGPLVAGLIVGVIHVFWHLPLFFTQSIPAADVVYIMAAAVVFAWMVVGSGGSVLLAMLMHASSNAISGEYISLMFDGNDSSTLGWIRAGIWCLVALVVAISAGPAFRNKQPSADSAL